MLIVITAFVGAMWGLERTTIPLIARQDFGITSPTITLSFIIGFGLTKAFANVLSGGLMDRVGRRRVLILGWAIGLPVPFLIIWAPQWEWIVAANLLLGINQGLCWTATILMMLDMMGAKRRGLATGLNEFAGYSGVAIATLATGFIAASFAPRPHPFVLGIGLAIMGLLLSSLLVRDTIQHDQKEATQHAEGSGLRSFWGSFGISLRDRTLLSCNQAGLVTKINDAAVWGLFPLLLTAQGLDIARIGLVAAIYPQVWGVTQLGTGILSDYVGRKPLIVGGMLLQGLGISLAASASGLSVWIGSATLLGIGTAAVYPTLIAAVGDSSPPMRRASAVGMYRGVRDCGFVVGGLLAGLVADAQGFHTAFLVIAGFNVASALLVAAWMTEPSRARSFL
jgi:MFS family permease